MDSTARNASSNVSTFTTRSPSGTFPTTSEQFFAGAKNHSADAARAPSILCVIPPMGPTVPSKDIVPVPAIRCPPVNAPGVNLSYNPNANIVPADGPPTSPALICTFGALGNRASKPTPINIRP